MLGLLLIMRSSLKARTLFSGIQIRQAVRYSDYIKGFFGKSSRNVGKSAVNSVIVFNSASFLRFGNYRSNEFD